MASNLDHSTTFNELIKLSGVWLFIHFSVVGIDIRDAILVGISWLITWRINFVVRQLINA